MKNIQKNLFLMLLCCCFLLVLQSCKKESLKDEFSEELQFQSSESGIFDMNQQSMRVKYSKNSDLVQTKLGRVRKNPFTIKNVADAHRSLYNSSTQNMPTTHLYVKFSPATKEDLDKLLATDEFFYDYPLEYEVIEMGDYYQETQGANFPHLYAIVAPNFSFPISSYIILAELYLDKTDPLLVAESFRMTGQRDLISSYVIIDPNYTEIIGSGNGGGIQAIIPEEPDCGPGCVAVLQIDHTTTPVSFTWICDCGPQPPNGNLTTNDCGCQVFTNGKKPGGCVKVEDTELSSPFNFNTYEPVRSAKVLVKDTWFTEDETWTDDNGCWKINKEYSGKVWVWIKFKNDRCKIRGVADNWKGIWQWSTAIKDYVGVFTAPPYNNIAVNYDRTGVASGSQGHRYWGAATINNAVHEFHEYAAADGINPPPNGLDIFAGRNHTYGYALMSAQELLGVAVLQVLESSSNNFISPFELLVTAIGFAAAKVYLPDVYIGIDFTNSDALKSLAYHELAHASHFSQVGILYWKDLISAEIYANGHGNQNSNNAGLIAVCESWAEYIGGHHYVHKTYGANNSLSSGTWERRVERTRNERPNHIPVGLYHDLVDIGESTFIASGMTVSACNQDGSGCVIINDNVSGFTTAQMFSSLVSNVRTINQYQTRLTTIHLSSTSNTVSQVNSLFNSY